jgi:hypothetical protein
LHRHFLDHLERIEMTEFEVLLVPVSLILGLGVTRILSSFVAALRRRRTANLHWIPLTWAGSVLLFLLFYFNVLFDLGSSGQTRTWSLYGSVLLQTLLLFLSAGLVLPTEMEIGPGSMLEDFESDGRLALIPLAVLLGTAPLLNRLQYDAPWVGANNVLNVALTAMLLIALRTKSNAWRSGLCVAFGLLTLYGMLFVWAQPGA